VAGGHFQGAAIYSDAVSLVTPPGVAHGAVVRYDGSGTAQWARAVAADNASVQAVAPAGDGSLFVCGAYEDGSATVNPGGTVELTLEGGDEDRIFVARFASDGSLLWARSDGGADLMEVSAAATLADGSCVVGGFYLGTAVFGAGEATEATAASQETAAFVARFAADGSLSWVKFQGGTGHHLIFGLTVLLNGTIVVTGYFDGTSTFGAGESNETVLATSGYDDAYFLRLAPADGSLLHVERVGGAGQERGIGVCGLADGSIAVCGLFGGESVTFDLGEQGELTVPRDGPGEGLWLARFGIDGSVGWIAEVEGEEALNGGFLAPVPDGGVALACSGPGTATFGRGEAGEVSLTSVGNHDLFVARYGPDGRLLWARSDGGPLNDEPSAIVAGPAGTVVLAGTFDDEITLGGVHVLTSPEPGSRGFVARVAADGTY
jgi:hypothetical protein